MDLAWENIRLDCMWFFIIAIGCYRFSDGSFMKYVNYSKRSLEVRISAPIFQENRVCEVEQTFEFIRDGEEWKTSNEGNIFSIEKYDSSVKEIKVNRKLILNIYIKTSRTSKRLL